MKHLFLLAALAVATLTASARGLKQQPLRALLPKQQLKVQNLKPQQAPQTMRRTKAKAEATAEPQPYALNAIYAGAQSEEQIAGGAATVAIDGDTYTITGLFPGWDDAVCVCKREGNKLIIDPTQVVVTYDLTSYGYDQPFDLVAGALDINFSNGQILGVHQATLDINPETGVITSGADDYLGLWTDGQGAWTYEYQVSLEPVAGNLNKVELPATARVEEYIYSVCPLGSDEPTSSIDKVAFDGDNVYLYGLNSAWIKGTRQGNEVSFPTNQYIGIVGGCYTYFMPGVILPNEETGYYEVTDTPDELVFTIDEDNVMKSVGNDNFAMSVTYGLSVTSYVHGITLTPYKGDVIATPVDPVMLAKDFTQGDGYDYIAYQCNNVGTKGEYLNTDHISLAFYYDGEPLLIDPEVYTDDHLTEPVYELPYHTFEYDFYFDGPVQYCYLYDMMFERVGVQVVYTLNGVRKTSNVVYIDADGVVTTDTVATETTLADYYTALRNLLNEAEALDFDNIPELEASALNVAEANALEIITRRTATEEEVIAASQELRRAINNAMKLGATVRATAIDALSAETPATRAIYNLQGQRLTRAHKGLNIIGGHKVLVK